MKVKVANLTGWELTYFLAKVMGIEVSMYHKWIMNHPRLDHTTKNLLYKRAGQMGWMGDAVYGDGLAATKFAPTLEELMVKFNASVVLTFPLVGGKETEIKIWLSHGHDLKYNDHGEFIYGSDYSMTGYTPMEALTRHIVASKFGYEVEVPNGL